MKKLLYIFSILIAASSCVQPEVGYISDNIHALEDTVFVPRGSFMTSAAPAAEGSTYPLKWVITDVQDENGNSTNELFEEHEILIWTSAFNPDTDTTLALAEEKLELSMQPTLLINDVSGELAFTQASKFVENDIFNIDVNVSNVRGDRQLDSFVVVKMMPFRPVEFPSEMRSRNNLIKVGGGKKDLYTAKIINDYDDAVPSVLDGTHPYFTVTKLSDEPALGIKVNMVVADSHDNAFPAGKVIKYPNGASYYQNFHDNSTETVVNDFSTTFSLPAPPFPQFGRNNWGALMYYLSTRDAFTVDKEAYEADYGAQDWSGYQVNDNGDIICEAYIRWGIQINDSGTWEIKMRIPYSKVIQ
ncbi:DUF5007 domain-containing protein [Maribellus sediminis]|uniref:DUF5007 domain-containing protein n=1 Tax=Maribellus sediminis TaxID=2696285 RepID=UPI001430201A|nr:DUF5007 domain-containing protein [Maribellus sediminis]